MLRKKDISVPSLIKGCKKDDLGSQELLYKEFYGYAKSICLRYCATPEEASEVLNDSFMKVFARIYQFTDNTSFKFWLRRIIINTSIDYYRKNKKSLYELDVEDTSIESPNADGLSSLSAEDIIKLINQLPDPLRITFNLYEIEGYSHKEIAETLNISESSSRSNLTRAKRKLRTLYATYFNS